MESQHVYVGPAFQQFINKTELNILEIGFGTGLNALLTLLESQKTSKNISYETLEPFPVPEKYYSKLNYTEILSCKQETFLKLHHVPPNIEQCFDNFIILKKQIPIEDYVPGRFFDVIYFDAFSPDVQPEIWTTEIFNKMYNHLSSKGILLTYSAKGLVKRSLRDAGFNIKRLPGAGKKHHMIKAIKTD